MVKEPTDKVDWEAMGLLLEVGVEGETKPPKEVIELV